MNEERIARLEGLLERVRTRAKLPRDARPIARATEPQPEQTLPFPLPRVPVPEEVVAAKAVTAHDAPAAFDGSELPTGKVSSVPPRIEAPPSEPSSIEVSSSELSEAEASEIDVDSEVSVEVVEVDVDVEVEVEEPEVPSARSDFESGAQRVAAAGSFAEEEAGGEQPIAEAETFAEPAPESVEASEQAVVAANELEVEPPASSRRSVIASEPPPEPYPSEPRHTPPPESGKQVAASSAPAARVPSVAPRVAEETFSGAWREPGLASQPPLEAAPPVSVRPSAHAPSAEVFAPSLPAEAQVARIEGERPSFAPRSFGELLEASLSL